MATHPMELIHMDYIMMESGKPDDKLKQDMNVLVITEHFTRYAQAFVLPSWATKVEAQTMWDEYFIY